MTALARLPVELQRLAQAAVSAHRFSYCPYSNFAVGAALLHSDGSISSGCNYENCTFQSTCAERCAIVAANANGKRTARAVAVYGRSLLTAAPDSQEASSAGGDGAVVTTPCGLCRQLLEEVAQLTAFSREEEGMNEPPSPNNVNGVVDSLMSQESMNDPTAFLVVLVTRDASHAKLIPLPVLLPDSFGPRDVGMNLKSWATTTSTAP